MIRILNFIIYDSFINMTNAKTVENFANDYINKEKQFYPLIGSVYTNDCFL